MFKFNNSIVPNKVRIGRHFSSNKYAYRDAYSALKSIGMGTSQFTEKKIPPIVLKSGISYLCPHLRRNKSL